jgi:phage pi2 protein 07
MALLDEFGRTIQYKAARAANDTRHRPYEPIEKKDISQLIPSTDRVKLMSHARRIYINFGPVKNAINQRSMYSVGRAYVPQFKGTDMEFGATATDWLINTFYAIGDTRGGMHDFKTNLFGWSSAIDVDGEIFILLTETKGGFPQYQGIPSHRIGNPNGYDGQQTRGGILQDGIVYYPSGEAKEYAFLDKDGKLIEWLPAANVIHLYDPEWQYQGRGLTGLTHCINDCRDIIQSTEWERLAMMQMSSISLVEYNEKGGPDSDDTASQLLGNADLNGGMTVETLDGGTVRYFKSNSGGKIETLVNNRPGNPFMDFHDRLLKSAYAGLNWPYAFYNGHGAGGGTAQRTEIAMAQRSIEDRQDLLFYAAKRIISYSIAKAQKRGDLPQSADWWKWDFSTPPKLTIDDGRVMKELESAYKLGFKSASDITAAMGKEYKDVITQKCEESAMRQVIAREVGAKYGVEIEQRELLMLTPNEQAAPEAAEPITKEAPDNEPDSN